jgi:hypothetical protein
MRPVAAKMRSVVESNWRVMRTAVAKSKERGARGVEWEGGDEKAKVGGRHRARLALPVARVESVMRASGVAV